MSKVSWAVQDNFISFSQFFPLLDELEQAGVEYKSFGIVPFTDDFPLPEFDTELVVPYGSTSLMQRLLRGSEVWKGFFFNSTTFKPSVWCCERDDMFNSSGMVLTLGNIQDAFWEGKAFVRPNGDFKAFNGGLYTHEEIAEELLFSAELDKSMEIWVSHERKLGQEVRWFIVGGEIVSGSTYKSRSSRRMEDEDFKFAQSMADKWLPASCCVMDTIDDEVVEFNCINASGFYDHDIGKIVRKLTDYVSCL